MSGKLGENIAIEWAKEPSARELWDALQALKADPISGANSLRSLAEDGSPLAMMYLGQAYSVGKSGMPIDNDLAESWLRKSAENSVEGGYQLARHFQKTGRIDDAISEFSKIAEMRYSPAMFALGWIHYKGGDVKKDNAKALYYFNLAKRENHLHAANWINNIHLERGSGILSKIRGILGKIKLSVPFIVTATNYPKSDRLRC